MAIEVAGCGQPGPFSHIENGRGGGTDEYGGQLGTARFRGGE